MQRWKGRQPRELDAGSDTLSRLLEREEHLARGLEAAKEEAGRLLREAEGYARERDAACDAMIRDRTARLAATHEAQLQADLRSIDANAEAEARRFDDPDGARMQRLVEVALESIGARGPQATVSSP